MLCSLIPANRYSWAPNVQPADTIIELNKRIEAYARTKQMVYVDFYTPLVDNEKGLSSAYGKDGVHPTIEGYKVIEPLVIKGIEQAISR